MKTSLAILALGAVALAHQSNSPTRVRQRHRRSNGSQLDTSPSSTPTSHLSQDWAGAWHLNTGVTKVEGSIVVPSYTGGPDDHEAVSFWVGIDGVNDKQHNGNLFQTGFDLDRQGGMNFWYEWWPDQTKGLDFDAKAGDKLHLTVELLSNTTGLATIENLTTGLKVFHNATSPIGTQTHQGSADWIIENLNFALRGIPVLPFGTVTFTNTSAVGANGKFSANGGTVVNEKLRGVLYTDCAIQGDDVTCKYIGPNP